MSTQNPQSLRIFTIISQLEQLLESAPRPKIGSGGRRLIDVDEIFDLLGDMKVTIPEDIRRANSVLLEQESLIYNANMEASDIIEHASQEAGALKDQARNELIKTRQAAEEEFAQRVAEHPVLLEVQRRCELLQQQAEYNANLVFNNAKEYADAILQDLQRYLMEYHQLVGKNRSELNVSAHVRRPEAAPQPAQEKPIQPSQQVPPQPVIPVQPEPTAQAPQQVQHDTFLKDDEDETPPKRRGGLFRKSSSDFMSEEEENEMRNKPGPSKPPRRGRKLGKKEELDLDLDE